MAITILDDLPEFLKNFLIRRGIKPPVDPNAVPVSSGLVPVLPKRRVVPENAYTSGDIDVDPPANIPFDSSYFSNLLGIGGLFGGSENTPSIDKNSGETRIRSLPRVFTLGELEEAVDKNSGETRNKLIEVMTGFSDPFFPPSGLKIKTDRSYSPLFDSQAMNFIYPVVHPRFDEEVPLFPDALSLIQI